MDKPQSFTVTLLTPSGEHTIRVGRNERIWDAAQAAGIRLPALCHQGWCLTCAGRLEDGGKTDQSQSEAYFTEDRQAGYVLLCTGKPCSDLRIHTHQAEAMRRARKAHGLPAPYLVE
jgi:ferredoxin